MPKQKENTKKQCIGCWFSLRNSEGILMISFITKPFIPPSIACWGSIFKQCGFSQPASSTLQHNGSIYFWLIPYMSWFRYFFKLFNFHAVYVRIPNMVSKYSTRWEVNKYLCLVVSWYNSVSWIKVHSRWTAVSLYLDELLIQKCQVNSEVISKCQVLASTSFPEGFMPPWRIQHESHTCSETSLRILMWNASYVQKTLQLNLTGNGKWPDARNSVKEFFLRPC